MQENDAQRTISNMRHVGFDLGLLNDGNEWQRSTRVIWNGEESRWFILSGRRRSSLVWRSFLHCSHASLLFIRSNYDKVRVQMWNLMLLSSLCRVTKDVSRKERKGKERKRMVLLVMICACSLIHTLASDGKETEDRNKICSLCEVKNARFDFHVDVHLRRTYLSATFSFLAFTIPS